MKIVLAPDSFKGSLSSPQVCEAMTRGARRVWSDLEIVSIPLADGGEGTLEALLSAVGGTAKTAFVRGPLDEAVEAHWAYLHDGTAIIETAQASGLTLTPPEKRDALRASSWGVGQLIQEALNTGCRQFMVGLGGSAMTDGGMGALSALGARFLDERECMVDAGGMAQLRTIDLRHFDPRLKKASFTLLCDVSNPLYGPNGAAHIYSAQKGASPAQVEVLDAGLKQLAAVTSQTLGEDFSQQPGAGAAGGLGFGLMAFLKAQTKSGIEAILQATQFEAKIAGADLILTGEGALDSQTLSGKTIAGICRVARENGVPVIAFGGMVNLTGEQMDQLGLLSAFSIADRPRELAYCLENARPLLEGSVERALRVLDYATVT